MRILAIETVGLRGSVALLADETLLVEQALDPQMRSAQSLAPGIAAALRQANWQPRDVELVAVAVGPGSFTGLRIGVTTAKTFAYAVGAQVIGVHSLAAIASRADADCRAVQVILDAGRNELYVADYAPDAGQAWVETRATRIVPVTDWLAKLQAGQTIMGPAVAALADQLPAVVRTLDAALNLPTAAVIGRLGLQQFLTGRRDQVFDLVPEYYRRTAAEEQWERKHG